MDRRLRSILLGVGVLVVLWAAYRQRPVRQPELPGKWQPLER